MLPSIASVVNLTMDRFYENVTQPTTSKDISDHGFWPLTSSGWLAWMVCILSAIGLWGVFCSIFRFKHEKAMLQRFGYINRASMSTMTNDEAQKILKYIMTYEFPLMYKLSLQFALFKVNINRPLSRHPQTANHRSQDIR